MAELLAIDQLNTSYKVSGGSIHAVNHLSLRMDEGEIIGLVGESGSGKSTVIQSIFRLLPPNSKTSAQSIRLIGSELLRKSDSEIRILRESVSAVAYQDPMDFFNADSPVGRQITDKTLLPKTYGKDQFLIDLERLLKEFLVPEPGQVLLEASGQVALGTRQILQLARAIQMDSRIIVADACLSAVDPISETRIIDSLKQKCRDFGTGIIWITNKLGFLARLVQRVIVMQNGYLIEDAPVRTIFSQPQHPYTLALMRSLPRVNARQHQPLATIPGEPQLLLGEATACPFAARCKYRVDRCHTENPPLTEVSSDHFVACWVDLQTGRVRQ